MELANFDIDTFLRSAWQQQPLLIRTPWAEWVNPLSPDELAGLAGEDAVESRLVARSRRRLICEHGPFNAARFARLDKKHWTLLVQAVDRHVPAVAALIEPFRFVPNWRIDDVMVSYAVDGGGVGAHFDHYDVFLIQGLGRRRWRVGQACTAATALVPHDDLRLLAEFMPTAEYLLEPGDILYLPPGIAHEGVAVGDDCMTYSVGFRAPASGELIGEWGDYLAAQLPQDVRYTDAGLAVQENPGEIAPGAIAALHALVTARLSDRAAFARWFGQYATAPKYPHVDWRPDAPIVAAELAARTSVMLYRNPASRFAFVRQTQDAVMLFVDGECFDCRDASALLAERLCGHAVMAVEPGLLASAAVRTLIAQLYDQGSVSFAP